MSFMALLEEVEDEVQKVQEPAETPNSEIDDAVEEDAAEADDGETGADDDDDLAAEIEAELEEDDEEEDDDEEDPEGTADEDDEETDDAPMTAATPGPGSVAPTPAAATPAGDQAESDDNKIGEEDLEDDEDMQTPAAPHGTPGSMLAVQQLEEMQTRNAGMNIGGGELPDEMKQAAQKDDESETKKIDDIMQRRQQEESKLVTHFDSHQMERYEYFKRSRIAKPQMKKLVDAVAGKAISNPNVVVALCGVTKMYVGELVETARVVASNSKHFGPLLPVHVYEAYRIMQADNKSVSRPKRARLFR